MRKLTMLVVCTGLLLTLIACSDTSKNAKKNKHETQKNVCDVDCEVADMSEYATMQEEDHVFKEITFAKANQLLSDESFTGVIYYGYPSCPWCMEAVPIMNDAAMDHELTIYYVNKKSQDSIDHPEEESKAISILESAYELDKDENGEPHLYVPEVVVVKKGKILSHKNGTIEGHDAHERTMNDDEARILKTIYENMFAEIVED